MRAALVGIIATSPSFVLFARILEFLSACSIPSDEKVFLAILLVLYNIPAVGGDTANLIFLELPVCN